MALMCEPDKFVEQTSEMSETNNLKMVDLL